jgi:cytidine deaminase
MTELDEQDAKLVTLARGARGRVSAATGAALRDETGRTYSSANVELSSVRISALVLVVAQAAASGARGVEAAVLVGAAPAAADVTAVRDLGGEGVAIIACGPDGQVFGRFAT